MIEQYFGTKQLYEVSLRATIPFTLGARKIEKDETVLYFTKINIAMLGENSRPIMARGGWGNMPHVIWEDRSEVTFSMTEGVMNSVGMGLLMGAKVLNKSQVDKVYVQNKYGPIFLPQDKLIKLPHTPSPDKKIFTYLYERDSIQKKVENTLQENNTIFIEEGVPSESYVVDYYYEYGDEALIYLLEKERLNTTFSLEGKFYTKDENDGFNVTNLLYMPKIRIVSGINMRMGEYADPTTSIFNIIAMPVNDILSDKLIMKITRLNEDVEGDF